MKNGFVLQMCHVERDLKIDLATAFMKLTLVRVVAMVALSTELFLIKIVYFACIRSEGRGYFLHVGSFSLSPDTFLAKRRYCIWQKCSG